MEIKAVFPPKGRDLRLDLLRGIANWAIFLNHMPNNAVNWITTRNYGFSDGADLFVYISGYTAALVFGRMMRDYGFVIGATRLWRRVWQLYLAHVIVLVVYLAVVGYVAFRFQLENIVHQFNTAWFGVRPFATLLEGLLLRFKPLNLDVLPLYIVLMAVFPFVLWIMLRRPNLSMLASLVLYFAARHFGWNLAAYPEGTWFFNPFCWQFLFCLGAWSALGGGIKVQPIVTSQWLVYLGFGYLLFALIMTLAGPFETIREAMPAWLYDAFNPNDKTNLAPYRALHFVVIVLLVTRFLPKDWKGLEWPIFDPLITCGQQSLRVFCVGVFLSFLGYFLLTISSGTFLVQVLISAAGIAILCGFAYYGNWSKNVDKIVKRPPKGDPTGANAAHAAGPLTRR
ncbi:OpgC domain-containing protein [Bradyrhizobium sp. Ash2021]|nr:OpgC domain-containing protein [Bradyrhizobium sp. Ash2021]WMT79280.1 OpgC domain-containing protein [Bradyrhizobium sp. Ash2021]